ncbi:MAG: glycosyltransferase [Emcibacteraceae bacterium]|nr:glycosyltransferase [Emcibacteraceae bacterium]
MINILTISTQYPSELLPHDGFAISRIADELHKTGEINHSIVVPYPDFPYLKKFINAYGQYDDQPEKTNRNGIKVYHPRYFSFPGGYFTKKFASMAKAIDPLIETLKPDLIEGQNLYPAGLAAYTLAKQHDLPLIYTIRDADPERWLDNKHIAPKILMAADYAQKIICETEMQMNTLLSYGFPEEKLTVIENGIDNNIFNPSAPINPLREKYFLSVGRLTMEKAHHVTLNAFAGIQKQRLIIVGDGNQRRALKKQAQDLGIKGRVQFIKHLEQSKLAEFYAGATATILMAYDEGMINTIHESLATGTPIIAPNVGDMDKIIDDKNGILLDDNDDYQLMNAIKKIKASDYDRDTISNSTSHRSWQEITQKFLNIYKNTAP